MRERLAEIRDRAQRPVRHYNDIAGRLVGDHVAIHVTRMFLALGIGPTVATIGMLVLGVTGALLVPFGGVWTALGFACVFGYYVCDCVDGEVARYRGAEKLEWGFHDFLFHLYVKTAFFLALGALIARTTGAPWTFLFGISGLLATLLIKFLDEVGVAVAVRQILMRPREEHRVQLEGLLGEDPGSSLEDVAPAPWSRLGLVRAVVTNFDLASLLFLATALLDLVVPTFSLFGLDWSLTSLAAAGNGVVLPLDFADRMQTAIRRDEFGGKARRLLRRADEFRID